MHAFLETMPGSDLLCSAFLAEEPEHFVLAKFNEIRRSTRRVASSRPVLGSTQLPRSFHAAATELPRSFHFPADRISFS